VGQASVGHHEAVAVALAEAEMAEAIMTRIMVEADDLGDIDNKEEEAEVLVAAMRLDTTMST